MNTTRDIGCWIVLAGMLLAGNVALAQQPDARVRKKLIATGWDQPDAARLLANYQQMEKQPFDGVVINIVGQRENQKACPMNLTFSGEKWDRQWFEESARQIRACKFQRFTDNFIIVGANPGNVDWFDDAGWANIVEHWKIAAWLARQSGIKGILFDPEPYAPPAAQFKYAAQNQRGQHTFDEYCDKTRQRGREVMAAVVGEYPQITIFSFFLNSVTASAAGHANPRSILAGHGYGLLPAFVDGWLDTMPATVRLVDGCESAYLYNSDRQYMEAALLIKGACQELVWPENRLKYRGQVQVSFGMYLDAYYNPPASPWYVDGQGSSRTERLRINASTALRCADEYVWVYGEKFRWWPTPNKGVKEQSWPEAIPGCDRALRWARDPEDYARVQIDELRQGGKLANLLKNGDFSQEKMARDDGQAEQWREGGRPVGWSTWQDEKSKGAFTWDRDTGATKNGAAKAAGVGQGCFLQSISVKPGERYAITARRKTMGKGEAGIRIRWQTAESKWTEELSDVLAYADGPADQWREIFSVAQVPATAGKLVVLLSVGGQIRQEDVAWFDDAEVYRVE